MKSMNYVMFSHFEEAVNGSCLVPLKELERKKE
jgi:hypothetical protein